VLTVKPALVLVASMLLFVGAATRLTGQMPVWHEVVSALPGNPGRVLGGSSCLDEPRPLLVVSSARPHLSLCVGHQALPVMVTPYASGLVTWPFAALYALHEGDTFCIRHLWIVLAALSLGLTFRLVSRAQDRSTAALVCVMTACSAPFLVVNSVLVPFETLPCTLVVAALSAWSEQKTWRLLFGAFFAGLAVASNVKALFLLVPVIVIALRSGVSVRGIGWACALGMVGLFLLPIAPMALFAALDPHRGFAKQVAWRSESIVQNLRWSRFVSEPLLLFNFAGDVGSYFDLAQGGKVRWSWPQAAVAVPIAWCVAAGIARLVGRRLGSPLTAACGAIIVTFFFVSILLYRQYPGGNYAPLHEVFGVALAAAAADLGRRLGGRRGMIAAAVAVGVLSVLGLAATLRRNYAVQVVFSINAAAERDAANWLRAHDELPLLSTTYNLAGVFDSLGRGRVHAVQVHEELEHCDRRDAPVEPCLVEAWSRILSQAKRPLRVIAPTGAALVDRPVEATRLVADTLRAATAKLGLSARLESQFATAGGADVLALYRID
jgi:hypothetical protein